MIEPRPTDMIEIEIPADITTDNCRRLGTVCDDIKTRFGCAVELYRRTAVQYSKTDWREDLQLLIPSPKVIIDGGANTGQTAAIFREWFPEATIYSFEPIAAVWGVLEANYRADDHVVPVKCALGAYDGTETINVARDPQCSSFLKHEPTAPYATRAEPVCTEEVPIRTLDSWLSEQGIDPRDVGILKMDLQGGELAAIEGARGLLKHGLYVFTEVMFIHLYLNAPLYDEIDAAMVSHGYRCRGYYISAKPLLWADALYERETTNA